MRCTFETNRFLCRDAATCTRPDAPQQALSRSIAASVAGTVTVTLPGVGPRDVVMTRSERKGAVVYGVPYSEHSSFPELVACVRELAPAGSPTRIIPTVNARSAEAAATMVASLREASGVD